MVSFLPKFNATALRLTFLPEALDNWPTAPLLYDTLEGPMWTKPAPYILYLTYILVCMVWTCSFIVTMAIAELAHLGRLQVFYCYIGRIHFAFAEMIWYSAIFERLEREAWSLNAANVASDFSGYELINKYPSLIFGLKRGVLVLCAAVVFFSLGIIYPDRRWALWCGILVTWELIFRTASYTGWLMLPRIPIFRSWIKLGCETLFPKFMSGVMKGRESLRVSHERTSFREEDVEPLESYSKVWGFYVSFFRSFL